MLGTVGGDVMINNVDHEVFLGTVGGDVMLGTVGGDVMFPGESMQELLETIKIINNQGNGEFSASVKQMMAETRYLVRAYAKNSDGISYAVSVQVITKKQELTVSIGNGVSDWEGRSYPTVIINGTEWMAENLRARTFSNGVEISNYPSTQNNLWLSDTVGSYKFPNNWNDQDLNYGLLYNWYATKNPNQLCPTGWRMPTEKDFTDLIRLLGGPEMAGNAMKTIGHEWWRDNNEDATNASGFSARGAGAYTGGISPGAVGYRTQANFWTSTIYDTDANGIVMPRFFMLTKDNGSVSSNQGSARNAKTGMSVRCIKN